MLDRGLEEPPFANQPLVLSLNASLSCSTRDGKGRTPETPEVASQQSKRRRVHGESERSCELIQNEESVVEEIGAVAIGERSYEPSQTEESSAEEIDAAVIREKRQDDLPEIPAEQPQTNNAIEPTAFGELNTELDEYEQSGGIEINENPGCYQNTENIPTIEDQ